MATSPRRFYWDTCVFIAYLADDRDAFGSIIDDIGQFLEESERGECVIYCSTITMAEITRHNCKVASDFDAFLTQWGGGIIPISPDPNTMRIASELRSAIYLKTGGERKLHTPDAIHLASALTLIEAYGVALDEFHTFDMGKKRDPNGKGVPLLGYETWCEKCAEDPLVKRVIDLKRCKPQHPVKELDL
jgi:predicted nucleic acid-binding protein